MIKTLSMLTGFFVTLKTMKKIIRIGLILILIIAGIGAWILLGSATGFSSTKEYLYIRSNAATKEAVLDSLEKNKIVTNLSAFSFLANQMDYWESIKPGKYEIKKGSSLLDIVRMLRNGKQTPVDLVITKLRTKEDFARFTGARFEFDSSEMIAFLNNSDSLKKFDANAETALSIILPDTYQYFWNSSPSAVYQKLYNESKKFWNQDRLDKAKALNLTPGQIYTLASIVEEETNANEEKDTIASVYINRLKTGMALGADPTIKFALKDFSITWVRGEMLNVASPYNTYRNKGLPPGPICTPSKKTIDEVLNAPATSYLYFVASSAFNGTHLFSNTYEEHLLKARAYQAEDKKRREERERRKSGAS